MDGILFAEMKLDINKAQDYIKQLKDTVEKYDGTLTILCYNTTFAPSFLQRLSKLFEFVLKYRK